MRHLEETIKLLEEANIAFSKYMRAIDVQHRGDKQLANAAHVLTHFKMAKTVLNEIKEIENSQPF